MPWIIDSVSGVYSYTSSLLAAPIIYNAAADTITVAVRAPKLSTLDEFMTSYRDAMTWRNAVGELLGLPVLRTDSLIPCFGVTAMPGAYKATARIKRVGGSGTDIELIHGIGTTIPEITYTVHLPAKTVDLAANAGYTAPRSYWDTRQVFVNAYLETAIRYL